MTTSRLLRIIKTNFRGFSGKVFQQIRITFAPILADIFLNSHEAELIKSLLLTYKKQLISRINVTCRYIDDVLFVNTQNFRITSQFVFRWSWDQRQDRAQHFCFLSGFTRINWEGRSTSHFHLWQTWRSQFLYHILGYILWCNTYAFHLRPPMASISRSLNNMSGLSLHMDVSFGGEREFQTSFSNRNKSRNAWNRHWGMLKDIDLYPDNRQL